MDINTIQYIDDPVMDAVAILILVIGIIVFCILIFRLIISQRIWNKTCKEISRIDIEIDRFEFEREK